MKKNYLNIFDGENGIKDFLDPDKNQPTPLVELNRDLNPFIDQKVRIFAKMQTSLPIGNIKMLTAKNMLDEANSKGKLQNVHSLVEYSSGNTISSMAIFARLMGIHHVKAFISHEVFKSRIQLLRFFGVEVEIHEEPVKPVGFDPKSGIVLAEKVGKKQGWACLGQYTDSANPEAHVRWTGPQIWEQTKGKVTLFCSALGTTGTMVGTSKFLKKKNKKIAMIGVARSGGPVPGVRSVERLALIQFNWKQSIDFLEKVDIKESYTESLLLCRVGLLAGPSSGFALAGLKNFLQTQIDLGSLEKYRNSDGEVIAVFPCYDGPFQYLDEYFTYVDKSLFPKIINAHLLLDPLT